MIKVARMVLMSLLALITLQTVSASLNIDIDVKSSFVKDDLVKFDYIITSTEDVDIGYTPYINCPKAAHPLLSYKVASLEKNIGYTGSYEYMLVTEDVELQNCVAYIEVEIPTKQRFEKSFTIQTLPSIVFKALTCKDLSCETESKIFIKNEDIYLAYISEPGIVTAQGILKYPNGKTKNINLPASVKAEQIGTYELTTTVSKESYKTTTDKEQFGVIEKHAEIEYEIDEEQANFFSYFLVAVAIIVFTLLVVFIYIKKRGRNK